jgi:hypothetical protein
MAWSKVSSEHKKPLRWWLHKILCEYGWLIKDKDCWKTYNHHLKMCCDLGYNIYGQKINRKVE